MTLILTACAFTIYAAVTILGAAALLTGLFRMLAGCWPWEY